MKIYLVTKMAFCDGYHGAAYTPDKVFDSRKKAEKYVTDTLGWESVEKFFSTIDGGEIIEMEVE